MTTIKICGIKDIHTLQLLEELSVDYAGFVFAESKRRVTAAEVKSLLQQVKHHPKTVGVMVNPSMDEIAELLREVPLDVVQLHGQESPDFCRECKKRFNVDIWKAISVRDDQERDSNLDQYSSIKEYAPIVQAFLFDTHDPKLAGGTGKKFEWSQLPEIEKVTGNIPYFVAGGINHENVIELLSQYQPKAIDISSSVETNGVKDPDKIKRFVERVREYDKHGICK